MTAGPDTDQLLEKVGQGDDPARQQLLARHRRRLHRMVAAGSRSLRGMGHRASERASAGRSGGTRTRLRVATPFFPPSASPDPFFPRRSTTQGPVML